jgi:GntR family transcriptional regulator, transcriptional repressor for pyruvate dehydrogenase complex
MMRELLTPLKTESLKEVFISRFEGLILSGRLSMGQKLPSERELALQLGVSRPVVHEGLVDLATKGLISMKPRAGAVVNDFRREGSITLLNSLLNYHQGSLSPEILQGMMDMRRLIETETARLAARNRTGDHLSQFRELLQEESAAHFGKTECITDLDFRFHHLVAMASGNVIYPLFLNSLEEVYTNLSGVFFSDRTVLSAVFGFHKGMFEAIRKNDEKKSASIMKQILDHGEERLKAALKQ